MCTFPLKKRYETLFDSHIKSDTSSGDMNEKVDHWLDSLENLHKNYIIMPSESLNSSFLKIVGSSLFDHHQVSLIKKMKQYVI